MPTSSLVAPKMEPAVVATIVAVMSLTAVTHAQPTIHPGVGAGYTIAPNNNDESPDGSWNAEGFLLIGLRGTPIAIRTSLFSYGRESSKTVAFSCPAMHCASMYANGGAERATGFALDMVIPVARGPFVPYLVAGPAGVFVSRQTAPLEPAVHAGGLGLELGGGARVAVGRMTIFAEVKYFGTDATESQFNGNSVHMVPVTAGIAF